MGMKHIVKVQVPIVSSDTYLTPLVYDRAKRHYSMQEITPETKALMNGAAKAFFEAEWNGSTWVIGERVDNASW